MFVFVYVCVGWPDQGAEADTERDKAGGEGCVCTGIDIGLTRSAAGIFAHIQSACKYKEKSRI